MPYFDTVHSPAHSCTTLGVVIGKNYELRPLALKTYCKKQCCCHVDKVLSTVENLVINLTNPRFKLVFMRESKTDLPSIDFEKQAKLRINIKTPLKPPYLQKQSI